MTPIKLPQVELQISLLLIPMMPRGLNASENVGLHATLCTIGAVLKKKPSYKGKPHRYKINRDISEH